MAHASGTYEEMRLLINRYFLQLLAPALAVAMLGAQRMRP